jgi:KEOPS complex subunit Cgi121
MERVEGFDQYLTVAGFKNVRISDIGKFLADVKEKTDNACVQFFNAAFIAGREHLRLAVLNALTAFKNKVNISNSLAMETLLYASAQRQIKDALKLLGIKPTTGQVAVLILAETNNQASCILKSVSTLLRGERDDSEIEFTDEKANGLKRLFQISKLELEAKTEKKGAEKEALLNLIIEHMALLVTQR